VGLVQSG